MHKMCKIANNSLLKCDIYINFVLDKKFSEIVSDGYDVETVKKYNAFGFVVLLIICT